jgi:hypothetical protein
MITFSDGTGDLAESLVDIPQSRRINYVHVLESSRRIRAPGDVSLSRYEIRRPNSIPFGFENLVQKAFHFLWPAPISPIRLEMSP